MTFTELIDDALALTADTVKCTTPPATVEETSAVLVNVTERALMTDTTAVQRLSIVAAGQLFPAVAEAAVLIRRRSPVSGLFTVTE